jgi:hypothetical protein
MGIFFPSARSLLATLEGSPIFFVCKNLKEKEAVVQRFLPSPPPAKTFIVKLPLSFHSHQHLPLSRCHGKGTAAPPTHESFLSDSKMSSLPKSLSFVVVSLFLFTASCATIEKLGQINGLTNYISIINNVNITVITTNMENKKQYNIIKNIILVTIIDTRKY